MQMLEEMKVRLEEIESYLHIDQKRKKKTALELKSAAAGFWDDPQNARELMSEIAALGDEISEIERAHSLLDDAQSACELAQELPEEERQEFLGEAEVNLDALKRLLTELELSSWFSDELDHGDAIVTVKPGSGGLEAQDWCEMLFKMYLKYCDLRKWKVRINDAPAAEVIGLDRATFTVSGKNAYGMLKAEQGVHRLVRISPTDDKKRRQTTFAGVEVLPVLPDDIQVDLDMNDVRVDVFHASGPGGQGVNTTDSAVRLTHLPTGIVVSCQNERSQLQNKTVALQILKSKLYELEQEKRAQEIDELRGPKHDISWGNQIRSYVLYPYQLIKDLRTGVETGNIDAVLSEGQLDDFVVGYHRWVLDEKIAAEHADDNDKTREAGKINEADKSDELGVTGQTNQIGE